MWKDWLSLDADNKVKEKLSILWKIYVHSPLLDHQSPSVVGLVVRISAFQADGPGSIPGQRILFPSVYFFPVLLGL